MQGSYPAGCRALRRAIVRCAHRIIYLGHQQDVACMCAAAIAYAQHEEVMEMLDK